MTKEENELLTRTGPGTPCGELMRCYWQPAALSEELPEEGAPLPIRLLNEDLVLFRDDQGRPGLLGRYCSHRGADLSYGRVEDGGLRCIYHGWLFGGDGRVLDQPSEPDGGKDTRDSICHTAYPCVERTGVIFAYMGKGKPPLFPNFEFLSVPNEWVFTEKRFHECNYLQGNEGNIDFYHLGFLHYNYKNKGIGGGWQGMDSAAAAEKLSGRGAAPGLESVDAELKKFGMRCYKIRRNLGPDQYQLYIQDFVLPAITAFPGLSKGAGGYMAHWHVAIDDTKHWKYSFVFSNQGPVDTALLRSRDDPVGPGFMPLRNKSNRYLQDRGSMKTQSYCGIESPKGVGLAFHAQDRCVVEGQPIQDRTKEHLVSMDRLIVVGRKILQKAIEDVRKGKDPPNVLRSADRNRFPIVTFNGVLPSKKNWRDHGRELEEKLRFMGVD